MSPLDLFRSVRHTFASNRVRAFLTLLGVMIGSGSVVMLAGLMRGGKDALLRLNQGVSESNFIRVRPDEAPPKLRLRTQRSLSLQDSDMLSDSRTLDGADVLSQVEKGSRAIFRGKTKRITLVGAVSSVRSMYQLALERGRFIDAEDLHRRDKVCVVGHEVWVELLEQRTDLSDVKLQIEGQTWRVVGVLAHKPTMSRGDGTWIWNRKVLVPQTTYDALLSPSHQRTHLFVRLGGTEALAERIKTVGAIVKGTLLRRHLGVPNFKLVDDEESRGQERTILAIIQILLLSTGLLALGVGGINIMNIMLVTVTERTREIGIRRAVGASPQSILAQFLLEASLIGSVGGVLGALGGLFVSWAASWVLTQAFGAWTFYVEPWSVALGVGLSSFVGAVFGLMPALRASRLRPVEALRSE